ncbi:hypothetical protein SAQ01S_07340 [Sphingomonas aquatilis NBRC 16722]|uniref:Quinol monooxygenase YgiN n=1 Tax=Sphingomonas aquatilis TaxID=93063 RepID=A0AAW3TUC6_9SPHN|nr:hypothetical protein [Sphingomonas aquatilis]MBB3876116.1 quinol monooxygenase YgiN [Sphingomonas aquatilis]GEM70968.1 hypothetical protein SAQ01S_07340 [Sphingomonas aquatilis NBRC 16722]
MSIFTMLDEMAQRRRREAARRALAAMVEARRNSAGIISYVKHREAAKRGRESRA